MVKMSSVMPNTSSNISDKIGHKFIMVSNGTKEYLQGLCTQWHSCMTIQ